MERTPTSAARGGGRADSELPQRLDRYELLAHIASGGMATVYLARMRGLRGFERDVAIKRMHGRIDRDALERGGLDMLEEAKLAALIHHPNVVSVLDVGEEADDIYLVMPYIEGESLAGLVRALGDRHEHLAVPIVLRILADALAGLHAAHELCDASGKPLGLVHRDFSPQNILVGLDGATLLADFGIAKVATREGLTQEGMVKGKTGYMSPEQIRGRALDRRSDLWAAGVVAWEAFARERLYPPNVDPVANAFAICSETPRRLRSVRPDVPEAVDDAVAWALTADLELRCPSADELRRRLLQAWDTPPADVTEVGALVARLAGEKLAKRRRGADEALRVLEERSRAEAAALATREPDVVETQVSLTATPSTAPARRSRRAVVAVAVAALATAGVVTVLGKGQAPSAPPASAPPPPAVSETASAPSAPPAPVPAADTPPAAAAPDPSAAAERRVARPPTASEKRAVAPRTSAQAPPATAAASADKPHVDTSKLGTNPYEPNR